MRCVVCDTSAAPHELRESKCLDCLNKENTTLRLMVAHCIMAIENGEMAEHHGTKVFRQQFGESFVKHLKAALAVTVNAKKPEASKSENNLVDAPNPAPAG